VPLVAIEEPEVALHPAAAGVLLEALREASRSTQVLVTSHSPDLLDDPRIPTDSILAVIAAEGLTRIGPLDEVGTSALRDQLYTPGELLRLNQLTPDPSSLIPSAGQLKLFGPPLS
jgi:predicted ATPase